MGGWNIFYALLNFAILLAGLYFVGRKLVKKMYDNHRSKVAEDLQRSAAAAENAIQLEKDAERLSADGQRECREIIADAERRVGGGDARKRQLESNFEQELCHELDLERQRLLLEERRRLNRKEADRLIELAGQKMRRPEWSEARAAFKKSYTARLRRAFALSAGELVRISDQGELRAQLRTAEPVDIDTVLALDGLIIEALNNAGVKISESDIHVDTKVDADIIGGFSLQIGDTVFDGTIRNLLERSHEDIAGMEDLRGDFIECLKKALSDVDNGIDVYQIGHVTSASDGICRVSGLSDAMAGEMLRFEGGLVGMVMDLEQDNIGVVLLGEFDHVQEGDRVRCTGRIIEVPVGEELMGRVVDALGRPLDGRGAINTGLTRPIESPAPGVISRQGVSVPMATGIKAIDALVPIGRGQRELIIGDRQTGKTAIALDAISASTSPSARRSPRWREFMTSSRPTARWTIPPSSAPAPPSPRQCCILPPMPERPWANTSCTAAGMCSSSMTTFQSRRWRTEKFPCCCTDRPDARPTPEMFSISIRGCLSAPRASAARRAAAA